MENSGAIDKMKTIINSYDELIRHIAPKYESLDVIEINDVEINFKFEFNKLLQNEYFKDLQRENTTLGFRYIFKKDIRIDNIKCDDINIYGVVGKNIVIKNNSEICNICLEDSNFENFKINELTNIDTIWFFNLNVEEQTELLHIQFKTNGELLIQNCIFNGNVNIYKSIFCDVNFGDYSCVSLFNCNTTFTFCYFLNDINLCIKAKGKLEFFIINQDLGQEYSSGFQLGRLSFSNSEFLDLVVFKDITIKKLEFADTIFYSKIIENSLWYSEINYEAAKYLKHFAVASSDSELAEKHKAETFDAMLKDDVIAQINLLKNKITAKDDNKKILKKKLLRKCKDSIWMPIIYFIFSFYSKDRLLLWLNKYSNDFNRSWTRGVWFTFLVSMLSYFAINYIGLKEQYFVIDWTFCGFWEVSLGYLKTLDVLNLTKVNIGFDLTSTGQWIWFISRILIAYGIYQTIYAFYKYKK